MFRKVRNCSIFHEKGFKNNEDSTHILPLKLKNIAFFEKQNHKVWGMCFKDIFHPFKWIFRVTNGPKLIFLFRQIFWKIVTKTRKIVDWIELKMISSSNFRQCFRLTQYGICKYYEKNILLSFCLQNEQHKDYDYQCYHSQISRSEKWKGSNGVALFVLVQRIIQLLSVMTTFV